MLTLLLSWLLLTHAQCPHSVLSSNSGTLVQRSAGVYTPTVLIATTPAVWTTLPGASWVWESDARSEGVFTFLGTFTVPGWALASIMSVKLTIAADDVFKVKFNGVVIAPQWTGGYTQVMTFELKPWLQGSLPNRLDITVKNTQYMGGLLYKVEIT